MKNDMIVIDDPTVDRDDLPNGTYTIDQKGVVRDKDGDIVLTSGQYDASAPTGNNDLFIGSDSYVTGRLSINEPLDEAYIKILSLYSKIESRAKPKEEHLKTVGDNTEDVIDQITEILEKEGML